MISRFPPLRFYGQHRGGSSTGGNGDAVIIPLKYENYNNKKTHANRRDENHLVRSEHSHSKLKHGRQGNASALEAVYAM